MTGAAHINIQVDLADADVLPSVLRRRIGELERHIEKKGDALDGTELLLTRDILGKHKRVLAAVEEQLPVTVMA